MATKAKKEYKSDLPRRMYGFFITYSDIGAPSFQKFAKSIGATTADIERFRQKKEFERAYRECCEIRRDYLIDHALCNKFDAGFTKFLLSSEGGGKNAEEDRELVLKLEVSD